MVVVALRVLVVSEFRLDLECVGAKIISLCLQEVRRQVFGTVPIVEAQSRAERWSWDTPQGTFANDVPPSWLCFMDRFVEEVVEEQVF